MRLAVVFDTPYSGWDHPDHERQMLPEVGAWKSDEPEMEYQIAHALRERGHEVRLLGVGDDLQYLVRCLRDGSLISSSTGQRHFGVRNHWSTCCRACSRRRDTAKPARHRSPFR